MKYFFIMFCTGIILFICSCKNSDDSPVETSTPKPKIMLLSGYGSIIDSSYYKLWSDNSWDKFNRITTVNGITYTTIINNNGDEYYYSVLGYAGFKAKSQTLILFDKPLPSLPDTLLFNQQYTRATTFYYQGYNYTMEFQQSLTDTVSVSVPFGIFNSCLWFSSKSTISAGGQSETQNSQFWLAKGPADIKQTLNSGVTIVMSKGKVNGKGWGMSFPKMSLNEKEKYSEQLIRDIQLPLFRILLLKQSISK